MTMKTTQDKALEFELNMLRARATKNKITMQSQDRKMSNQEWRHLYSKIGCHMPVKAEQTKAPLFELLKAPVKSTLAAWNRTSGSVS